MAKPKSQDETGKPSRKTLRLTFEVVNGEVKLLKHQRVSMITPPSVGERPETGKHGGFWMELRDENDRGLFHRNLHSPAGDTVEVHSPDGAIRREYAPPQESTFEVLVPDYGEAASIVLVGKKSGGAQPSMAAASAPKTRELARFEIPEGGEQ
jgi:hypothetical protein